jgi:hypothetical protein
MEQDEDGWPPQTVETLWAVDLGDDLYKLENTPFFARGVAYNDVVSAERSHGELLFKEVVRPSGHTTVRIIFRDLDVKRETCTALEGKGGTWEGSPIETLISVDVPPSVRYADIRQFLDEGTRAEQWDYEEGCLGQE